LSIVPLNRKEAPDFERFLRIIRRQGNRDYVAFFEMILEPSHFEPLTGYRSPAGMNFMPTSPTYEATFDYYLKCCAAMGFDHGVINISGFTGFPAVRHGVADTARRFAMDSDAMITCEEDFDSYPWPSTDTIDIDAMQRVAKLAPEGMGIITGGLGIFQTMCDILGYTGLGVMIYENPELVERVAGRIGEIVLNVFDQVASAPFIDGILVSGDMGFKTGTFIAPSLLRKLIFPWHKKICDAGHRHGKIVLLHSCGNLAEVMGDIIDCGYDGKHSFEDAISPSIFDLNEKYGDRICLLGGVDVDLLCRGDEQSIRGRVRQMIDTMSPSGGYMLGSGNSIAEYVPLENYRVMLDEGLKYGRQ
jgi:uroporphyrinogen decarboxylase